MGIASVYVEPGDLLVIVWDGTVTLAEWQQSVSRQLEDESGWRQGRRRLVDITTADVSELEPADVKHVVETTVPRIRSVAGRRQAIVTTLDSNLANEFAQRSTQIGALTIVFDRLEPACAWLDVEASAMRPYLETLRTELRTGDEL
jgi:hypothetical protein